MTTQGPQRQKAIQAPRRYPIPLQLRYKATHEPAAHRSPHTVALADDMVTFRWRDSAHKKRKRLARLPVDEFLRRFFLHVLPGGFVRIRYFGFLAHRRRAELLPQCFALLAASQPLAAEAGSTNSDEPPPLRTCPLCQGPMIVVERLAPVEARLRSPPKGLLPCA